jgi:PTS system galactitol-specific IIA component
MSEQVQPEYKIDETLVKVNLQARDWEGVLREMGTTLFEQGYVRDTYIKGLIDRETEFPTGIATGSIGVAIPHTEASHVIKTTVAVAVLDKSVPFSLMGSEEGSVDVDIVFMLAVNNPDNHLLFLQRLMGIFQKEEVLLGIKNADKPEVIAEILNNEF